MGARQWIRIASSLAGDPSPGARGRAGHGSLGRAFLLRRGKERGEHVNILLRNACPHALSRARRHGGGEEVIALEVVQVRYGAIGQTAAASLR